MADSRRTNPPSSSMPPPPPEEEDQSSSPPPSPAARKPARPSRNFIVRHTLVGPFPQDRVVTETELRRGLGSDRQEEQDTNLQRLITLGAIEEVTLPASTEPLPPGPENQAAPPPPQAPANLTGEGTLNTPTPGSALVGPNSGPVPPQPAGPAHPVGEPTAPAAAQPVRRRS